MSEQTSLLHLTHDALLDYIDDRLTDDQAQGIEAHLAECEDCVEVTLRARDISGLVDGWTAEAHGTAFARENPSSSLPPKVSTSLVREVRTWLAAAAKALTSPQLVVPVLAADGVQLVGPDALAEIPALFRSEAVVREVSIEVVQIPSLGRHGELQIGIRIPHDLGDVSQRLTLWLIPLSDGKPLDQPIDVSPGSELIAVFQLPNELQEHWRDLEERNPVSWPFRFALEA